jgi:hypothetical protein
VQLGQDGATGIVVTDPGVYFVQLTVADSCAPVEPLAADVSLSPASAVLGSALSIASTSLPNASVGTSYRAQIKVKGGKKPYSFTAESALPAGLSLNKSTGVISGKPSSQGTFTFQVKISDSARPTANTITAQFRIKIS